MKSLSDVKRACDASVWFALARMLSYATLSRRGWDGRCIQAPRLGLPVLGAILGYRNQATTARYAHLANDPRQAGAARISGEIAAALNGQQDAEVIPFSKP